MKRNILKTALIGLVVIGIFVIPFQSAYAESREADIPEEDVIEEEEVKITELDISDVEEEMFVGDKTTLTVTPYPEDADTSRITYESSDSAVLEVTASGKVTAKKEGQATVTVRGDEAEEKTDKITLNTYYLTLKPGQSYSLKATASPATASQKFKYASTNAAVMTVSDTGQISAKAEGYASITVTNDVATETVLVIVNGAEPSGSGSQRTVASGNSSETSTETHTPKSTEIKGTDLPLLTADTLKDLAKSQDTLKIVYDTYSITIMGKDIGNAQNQLRTQIAFEETPQGISFVINEGRPLPGKFTLSLSQTYADYEYLYLYNQAKDKYQKLQYDKDTGEVEISEGGTYLLTNEKQEETIFNKWIIWVTVPTVLLLGIIYIVVKKQYWFW